MDREQSKFYRLLKRSLDAGTPVRVDGNVSYLFLYAYPMLAREPLDAYARLMQLHDWYPEESHFARYCVHWSLERLLEAGLYHRFIELTEFSGDGSPYTGYGNLRVNLKEELGNAITAIDWFTCLGFRIPEAVSDYIPLFLSTFEALHDQHEIRFGPWLDRIKRLPGMGKTYSHTWQPDGRLPFKIACYYAAHSFIPIAQEVYRESENATRDKIGLPRIGEGWVSETRLFYLVKQAFPHTPVVHHGRPAWLGRQHFDIWLPQRHIAIEYHGLQHYQPIQHFGGAPALAASKQRDDRKIKLASENGVLLIVVPHHEDLETAVERIRAMATTWVGNVGPNSILP